MNRYARRGLIVLGTGTAILGTALLGAGLGGAAVAGKGVTGTDPAVTVAGTNWDGAPAGWAGPTWEHTIVLAGRGKPTVIEDWAGPTVVLAGRGKPSVIEDWAGPTWAGPTAVEV